VIVEGMSQRAAARGFGLAWKTVSKMLEYSVPPGHQRQKPVRRPKLGPWQGAIDAMLEEDMQRPRKQRHTAKRIFERLRGEHGYRGGYTIVKDYVRSAKLGGQEMFVPLDHTPGEARADFGQAQAVIAGMKGTVHAARAASRGTFLLRRVHWVKHRYMADGAGALADLAAGRGAAAKIILHP